MKKADIIRQNGMVQFITHFTEQYSYVDSAKLALEGGCRWIQLRMKEASPEEIEQTALKVQALCKDYQATFIIDDQVKLVKKIQADGVHLGKNDLPIAEARRILGDSYIIGGTANTFADIQSHTTAGADYIGCGPFRYTTTKKNLSPLLGLNGYIKIIQQMQSEGISLPIVAIGGIRNEDIPSILNTGITGIALSGSILRAVQPIEEMKLVLHYFHGMKI
ncbi:thiamine-phosphate pyrophosphorylase [gut metagenome]|uniref:thiamine phosphate synthase n=1 Tax=gut metagenome TaxID=749906 RepID=J9BRM7_9ZZZZ